MSIDTEIVKQVKITPILDSLRLEDIDDSVYFSEKYSDYISNSRLGKLVTEGAESFFAGLKSDYLASFETGSLIHQIVLQGDKYQVVDNVFKPTAKAGLMAESLYKSNGKTPTDNEIKAKSYEIGYYKDKLSQNIISKFREKAEPYWRDRFIYEQNNPIKEGDKERIYTDKKNFELLNNCLKTLNANQDIQKLLNPSNPLSDPIIGNEKTILLDIWMEVPGYEKRQYKLKAKLDNFSIDTEDNILTVKKSNSVR